MIVGIGTDITEVARIRQSIERFGGRFLDRVFTAREQAYCLHKANRMERYAARFAAKEAGMKAIGTGWSRQVRWVDFEVGNEPSGRPTLLLSGEAARIAHQIQVRRVSISLTHTSEMAFAVAILEDGN